MNSNSGAKYINTPETLVYHKRKTLYGLNKTNQAIRREKSAIIVEGEFDVLSSFQSGVSNIVAVKGSGLTDEQLKLLKRYTDKLILALDSDKAGDEAIRRGVISADELGFDVRIVVLDHGKDPDELIRSDSTAWKKAVKKPSVFFDYVITSAIERFGTDSSTSKKQIVDDLAPFFALSKNSIVTGHYTKKLAKELDLGVEIVEDALKKAQQIGNKKPIKKEKHYAHLNQVVRPQQIPRWFLLEEYILSIVIQLETAKVGLKRIQESFKQYKMPLSSVTKILHALHEESMEHSSSEKIQIAQLIETLDDELILVANKAYVRELGGIGSEEEKMEELDSAIADLKKLVLKDYLKKEMKKLKDFEEAGEDEEREKVKKVKEKIIKISREIREIEK